MNIDAAKLFLRTLHLREILFHLDDCAHECIGHTVSAKECDVINDFVDAMFNANLDWGRYECPHGYCIALMDKRAHNNG